jgi:hypothetical protein
MKNDNKTKTGANIIHIEDSDDEVQYVSHKQQGHNKRIGDHVIGEEQLPQRHPPPHHCQTSSLQQPRPNALPLPKCGAMTTPDVPLTTNFNASNVGVQDNCMQQQRYPFDRLRPRDHHGGHLHHTLSKSDGYGPVSD